MKVSRLDLPENVKKSFAASGITELNPPQQDAVDSGLLEGRDMVVASPTASGKTLIAEMAMAKKSVEEGGKAVYIVPLKALAAEKYRDFSERYPSLDVKMSVGDRDESGDYLETADIVVATSEKLDSMLRHNPDWIHDVSLVVVDEIHLLTSPERGPTLEVTISRLRDLLEFQLLGLSATISNSDELADWLDSGLVESDYRPVDLEQGIYWSGSVDFYPEERIEDYSSESSGEKNSDDGAGNTEASDRASFRTGSDIREENEPGIEPENYEVAGSHGRGTLDLVEDTLDLEKQAIVFCSSRNGAEKSSDRIAELVEEEIDRGERKQLEEAADRIENVLGSPTSQCRRLAANVRKGAAFHHAGLLAEQRKLVEDAFRDGLVKTVSATPTLAAGINMPAFRVVMRDLKRYTGEGMDWIPVLEYEQMTGRAGRPEFDDRGEAISVAKKQGQKDEILERYVLGEPERIQSKLAVEPVLRMHTLSLVASRFCTSMPDLQDFYSETFYAHQFGSLEEVEEKIESVVEDLVEYGFLDEDLEPTATGRRVSELYIDPESAHMVLEALKNVEEQETRPVTYLFLVSRTTEMRKPRVKKSERSDIEEALEDASGYLLEEVPDEWSPVYETYLSAMKNAMIMQGWISELEEEQLMDRYGVAPGGIRAKTENADWLLYAAEELARLEEVDLEREVENLRTRLQHGIEEELLSLVKYDQIGRVRARKLHDAGIRDREAIRSASFEKLKKLLGKRTAEKLKKQVGQENIFDRENITDYFD